MFADKALVKTNEVAVVKPPGNLVFTYPQLIAIGTVVISTALCALFLSDIALQIINGTGFHATMPFVYGSFMLIAMLGFVLRKRVQRQTIMVGSLVGSLIFFFVTNFGTWITQGIYEYSFAGLTNCYIMAIPFFKGTVMGDLFYNLVLFGSYSLVKWKFPRMVSQ